MQEIINIIIPFFVGLVLILLSLKSTEKKKRVIANGIETDGIIFSFESSGISDSSAVYPVIRFVTKEGVWITELADMVLPRYLLKEGQKVRVIYNADNPKEFVCKTTFDFAKLSYVFLIAGFLCIAGGFWMLYKYFSG
jgi:hypothetical protein